MLGEGEWVVWRLADGDEVVNEGGGGWWTRASNRLSIKMVRFRHGNIYTCRLIVWYSV